MDTENAIPAGARQRLMSVDALRGFDMLWIIGAGSIVEALERMNGNWFTKFLATQLTHPEWEGFHFYDVIFPLFLFLVGVSLVFWLDKAIAEGGRGRAMWRVVRRSLLLYALGVFYSGGLSNAWPDVKLLGVLHRIALCYLFASLIYLTMPGTKRLLAVSFVLLVGYWGLVTRFLYKHNVLIRV